MWEFLLFFCWKGKSLEVAQLHWNLDDRNQDCSLGECIYVVWCSSSLKSKTVWLQRYEDVNLVFWCLWNGGHHNTSRWGNFSYSQQKADGHRASDLQFKFVSLCVCVFVEVSTVYPLCLSMWMNSLHTAKSVWLVMNALSFLHWGLKLNKSECACVRLGVHTCTHTCTTVCVARLHADQASCWAPRPGYI